MSQSAILEVFHEYKCVTYYTVTMLDDDGEPEELSETDKFYQEFDNPKSPSYKEFDTILRVLDAIGFYGPGAEDSLFRFEDEAVALPPGRKAARQIFGIEIIEGSTLRLYCNRLSNRIVVLLNGGIKTVDKALNCGNVSKHFRRAQAVAKAITGMLLERSILIQGKYLVNNSGDEQIILHF